MVATTLSASKSKDFIARLKHDYPDFNFMRGARENWSPKSETITYSDSESPLELRYGLLHELAHALLEHKNYHTDFELLKLESEAWELAAKIGRKYGVKISEEHIQNCLDTYRDWLHRRSTCPGCGMHVLQQDVAHYQCFNCHTTWKVSNGRFVRPYRKIDDSKQ